MEKLPRRVPTGDVDLVGTVTEYFFGNIIDKINDFIAGLLDGLDGATGGIFNLDDLADRFRGTEQTATQAHANAATAQSSADTAYHNSNVAYQLAQSAEQDAADAVDAAEVAANQAAEAVETADIAYANASYWEAECVVSSAEVLLGVNELLVGLCQNVPTGKARKITDIHIALNSQPGGMVLQTKKWNAAGTSSSVVHTATLTANQTRRSYNLLNIAVADKERIFWNVSSITGSVPPSVLQVAVFGVIL